MELNKKNIILPICLAPDITTECWNYYRMAIVNAYSKMDLCLINEFNQIYMDAHREIHYGFSMYKVNMYQVYSKVLNTFDQPISELNTSSDFITFVNRCLQNGMYPIVECDYGVLFKGVDGYEDESYIHEILIYGRQDDHYLIPCLKNDRWKEQKISEEKVAAAFLKRKTWTYEIEQEYFWRREYQAPFTILQPRAVYDTRTSIYDFYYDVFHILERSCIENQLYQSKEYYACEFSGVLAVYNGVLEMMHDLLDDRFDIIKDEYDLPLNIKRLYEYACLFEKHMKYYQKISGFYIPLIVYNKWKQLKDSLQKSSMLAIKYAYTLDKKVIYNLSDAILQSFKIHHSALEILESKLKQQLINL